MKPRRDGNLKWLGVDLDGTVAQNTGHPDYKLTKPIEGARDTLRDFKKEGWKIIVYTARPWSEYELIENWLNKNHIPHRRIVCGKLLVKWMIDDRNLEFDGDWDKVRKKIG